MSVSFGVRLAAKSRIVEDRQAMRAMPGWRVHELQFPDGSKLRVEMTQKKIALYLVLCVIITLPGRRTELQDWKLLPSDPGVRLGQTPGERTNSGHRTQRCAVAAHALGSGYPTRFQEY